MKKFNMTNAKKISVLMGLLAVSSAFASDSEKAQIKVKDAFSFPPAASVDMKGVLGDAMNTSLKGDILVWDIDDLVLPFKERKETKAWKIEFWGKWYTSAELAYDFYPSKTLDARLKYGAAELIKTQDPEGSITTYTKEDEFKFNKTGGLGNAFGSWDVWGRKYVLLGLLAEYDRTKDTKVLDAAKKSADYVLEHVGPGKKEIVQIGCWYGLASSSILEPMVLLYRATGDKKYLDFCEWVVRSWSENEVKPDLVGKVLKEVSVFDMFEHPKEHGNSNNYMDGGHSKAYEMMSCYEGLTELYRVTGNPVYKEAVEKVIKSINDREITILGSGSIHERWVDGAFSQQKSDKYWMETCVTATWIKFAAQLLRLTGDVQYANYIEIAAYNALLGAQKGDGSWWAHFSNMDGTRVAAPEQCKMHMNCCVANGPRGLFLLPKIAFMTTENGAAVNLYEKGGATLPLNDGNVDISVSDVDFFRTNMAVVTIGGLKNGSAEFELKLRIPEWSKNTVVIVGGKKRVPPAGATVAIDGGEKIKAKAGEYLTLKRNFKNGDEIYISFDAKTLAVDDPKNPQYFYLKHGPYVLAQDKRFEPNFDKPAKVKIVDGAAVATLADQRGANFAADVLLEDGTTRRFVDYSSAGATWNKDSEFTVWLKK